MPENSAQDQIPTYPGAALGYRSWYLQDSGLHSLGAGDETWQPGTNTAICKRRDRAHSDPPASGCHCGFNAYHHLGKATSRVQSAGPHSGRERIVGAIIARGKVEIHRDGFRAEHAQIVALLVPANCPTSMRYQLEHLAEIHNAKLCESSRELQQYAESIAKPIPREARPPTTLDKVVVFLDEPPEWARLGGLMASAGFVYLLRKSQKIGEQQAKSLYQVLAPEIDKAAERLQQELFPGQVNSSSDSDSKDSQG